MIAASDPLEYIPGGRQTYQRHPGSVIHQGNMKDYSMQNDSVLLKKLSKVNISEQKSPKEFWLVRDNEVYGEEELYCSGKVAVHSKGSQFTKVLQTSYTCDSDIKYALYSKFCTTTANLVGKEKQYDDDESNVNNNIECICLFDSYTLRVFTNSGEDYVSSLQFQISAVWSTKYGILMEKSQVPQTSRLTTLEPSKWNLQSDINSSTLPIAFSLTHPLDEICPVLVKHGGVNYMCESNYQIVFTSSEPSLAVIYDTKSGLHSVYKIRKASIEERQVVCDMTISILNNSTNASPLHLSTNTPVHKNCSAKTQLSLLGVPNPQLSGIGMKISGSPFGLRTASYPNSCSAGAVGVGTVGINGVCGNGAGSSVSSPSQQHQNLIHSRSQSPMATISRCQSPTHPTFSPHGGGSSVNSIIHQTRLHQTIMTSMSCQSYHNPNSCNSFLPQDVPLSSSKPLYPELCLEHIWTENVGVQKDVSARKASKVLLTTDLVGQGYLAYLVSAKSQLYLVKLGKINEHQIIFGVVTSICAKDAVNLPKLNMIAIIDLSNYVTLYSGMTCVGKVHITSPLLPSISGYNYFSSNINNKSNSPFPRRSSLISQNIVSTFDIKFEEALHTLSPVGGNCRPPMLLDNSPIDLELVGLKDAVGNKITLEYGDKVFYRVTLPTLSTSPLVTKCLNTLKSILQRDLAMQLLVKWYGARNAPGPQDFSPAQEWHLFMVVLFTLLGYDVDKLEIIRKNDEDYIAERNSPIVMSKKQRTNESGSQEDWISMSESMEHKNSQGLILDMLQLKKSTIITNKTEYFNRAIEVENVGRISSSAALFPYLPLVLFTLHLLYEELKLNCVMSESLPLLAQLLHQLSNDLNLKMYSHHYFIDFPNYCHILLNKKSQMTPQDLQKITWLNYMPTKPPNIFETVNNLLLKVQISPYPHLNRVNLQSKFIVQLIALIAHESSLDPIEMNKFVKIIVPAGSRVDHQEITTDITYNQEIVNKFEQPSVNRIIYLYHKMGMEKKDLDILPPGIALMFRDIMHRSRERPPANWPAQTYELVDRQDLATLEKHSRQLGNATKTVTTTTTTTTATTTKTSTSTTATTTTTSITMNSSTIPLSSITSATVSTGTTSTAPTTAGSLSCVMRDTEQDDGMNFDDSILKLRFNKDHRVAELRRLLNSSRPVRISITQRPEVSDHEFIEEQERHLCAVCSRTMALPVARGMFTLRTSTPIITEQLPIPRLCLTGRTALRGTTIELCHIDVPPNMNLWPLFHNGVAAGLRIHPNATDIDSTWIVYNKQQQSECGIEHSGFLMALGLNGHLKNLAPFSMYEYLVECHETTNVGLLLGLSATHRGTMDVSMTKLLSLHIETLLPPTSIELNVQQNVQVAALMGVGLVYEGTAHRHISHALLSEIGRPPGPEMKNCVDRESYSLAAGLALGLVVLGHGGETDLGSIPDTLHYYMVGGNIRPFTGAQKDKYKSPSYQIREGDSINIDVTSPGATIALGLMYFNSGNRAVAEWMRAPHTQFLLDFVRPDLLLLRILASALIMWNDIEPTRAWVSSHVPEIVHKYKLQKPTPEITLHVDLETMNQAYCNIIAGACMALGCKYAGTANEDAFKTLYNYTQMFVALQHKSIGELAGKSTIETCLNVTLLATAVVMAGTGNLDIMRLCRQIRTRVGPTGSVVTYGSHLATHMALGLTFLGGGRYTLSNSPSAVAALIISLFPKFPTHSNDNRYHLQALRHLYVLAAQPRLILPQDIDSRKHCYATIRLTFKSEKLAKGQEVMLNAPCLLPQLESLEKVELKDDRYWKIVFHRGHNWQLLEGMLSKCEPLYVKQKVGCLSYIEDPHGFKSLVAQILTMEDVMPWAARQEHVTSFTNDKIVLNIVKYFFHKRASEFTVDFRDQQSMDMSLKKLRSGSINEAAGKVKLQENLSERMEVCETSSSTKTRQNSSNILDSSPFAVLDSEKYFLQTLAIIVYECVIKDKVSLLPLWVYMYKSINAIEKRPSSYLIWQIKLVSSHILLRNQLEETNALLSIESVLAIRQRIALIINKWEDEVKPLVKNYLKNGVVDGSLEILERFCAYCTFHDIPEQHNYQVETNPNMKILLHRIGRDVV